MLKSEDDGDSTPRLNNNKLGRKRPAPAECPDRVTTSGSSLMMRKTLANFPQKSTGEKSMILDLEDDPSRNHIEEEKIVLIDTDAGTDDAWAIFMALAAHKDQNIPFRIVGFTCVHGNTDVDNVTVNVTRTLQTAGVSGLPIFRGCESALVFPFDLGDDPWNGHDGFGDANLPPLEPSIEPDHAVNAIIQFAEQYKGNLTILALGPLTNLAMALRLKPSIKHCIKDVFVLGGNLSALGNTTVLGEFNFVADAEAAHATLECLSLACPIYLVPWETALQASSTWKFRVETLGSIATNKVSLLNKIEAKMLENQKPKGTWLASDGLAIAALIEPKVVTRSGNYYCTVEVGGNHARGMAVVDKGFIQQKPANVTFIEDTDKSLYEKMLIWAAGGPHYNSEKKTRSVGRY